MRGCGLRVDNVTVLYADVKPHEKNVTPTEVAKRLLAFNVEELPGKNAAMWDTGAATVFSCMDENNQKKQYSLVIEASHPQDEDARKKALSDFLPHYLKAVREATCTHARP